MQVAKPDQLDQGVLTVLPGLRVSLVRQGQRVNPVRLESLGELDQLVPPALPALQEPLVPPEALDSPVQRVLVVLVARKDALVQQVLPDLQEALDLQVEMEQQAFQGQAELKERQVQQVRLDFQACLDRQVPQVHLDSQVQRD